MSVASSKIETNSSSGPMLITSPAHAGSVAICRMGETTSDYLARVLGPVVAGGLGLVGIVLLLVLQFRAPRYRAWTYWAAIVMVSVFGTMAADVVHVAAGVPYAVVAPYCQE